MKSFEQIKHGVDLNEYLATTQKPRGDQSGNADRNAVFALGLPLLQLLGEGDEEEGEDGARVALFVLPFVFAVILTFLLHNLLLYDYAQDAIR